MLDQFSLWLSQKLEEQGWSARELARRADISNTSINNIIARKATPTWGFCAAIAEALNIPEIEIFRLAGLLPWPDEGQAALQDLVMVANSLSEEKQQEVARYARFLMGEE